MLDLGFLFLLTLWAAGLGRRVLSRLGGEPEHPIDALALAASIGFGLLAIAALGLAEFGVLSLEGLAGLFVVGMVLGGGPSSRPARHVCESAGGSTWPWPLASWERCSRLSRR